MKWANVKLIFVREVRDQMRDRRTMFTIAVLPLLLYPLLGMIFLQIAQFSREHLTSVLVLGAGALPEHPRLFDGDRFTDQFVSEQDARRFKLTVRTGLPADVPADGIRSFAEDQIQSGDFDAVVLFPADFAEKLSQFREQLLTANGAGVGEAELTVPEPKLFVSTANDKSRIAQDRVERVLRTWRDAIVQDNLRQRNVPAAATEPFLLVNTDVARERSRRAAMWSKILPFIVLIWALTGAFYPAVDLCAGEKERGTLALSLSNAVSRSSILLGKWIGGYISFLMAFAPALILSLIILSMLHGVELHGEEWVRIGLIALLSFMYLSVFFNLGLFISASTRRSR